jgi:hypothetical protein
LLQAYFSSRLLSLSYIYSRFEYAVIAFTKYPLFLDELRRN